jgi:N-acyl-D-aspartate/D-glutamate deacylase
MGLDLHQFHEEIKKQGIMFCYSGPISQSTVEGIGATLRINMEIGEAGGRTTQSIFAVFVEQMQNILNYSAEKLANSPDAEKELRRGVLVIGSADDGFFVYCGNRIFNRDVAALKQRIEAVRLLDKDGLKALYKEKRKAQPDAGSKGAGLGLIDMARKAGKPIEFDFIPIDEAYSFFSIKVSVW